MKRLISSVMLSNSPIMTLLLFEDQRYAYAQTINLLLAPGNIALADRQRCPCSIGVQQRVGSWLWLFPEIEYKEEEKASREECLLWEPYVSPRETVNIVSHYTSRTQHKLQHVLSSEVHPKTSST